jgi:hypothetical protein
MNDKDKEYLEQISEEVHKGFKKKYPRKRVTAQYLDEIWSMDLVDMSEWSSMNDGNKFMLNIVDVFSRKAFARPMKNKTAKSTFDAFTDIINTSGRSPQALWVDEGKEFYNSLFEKWVKTNDRRMYSTQGEHKSNIVERFNKTLKTAMWKRFTALNTRRWVDMLPDLIEKYNKRKHSTLKMSPDEASLEKNKKAVELKVSDLSVPPYVDKRKAKFAIGDTVRIARTKGIFEKGYLPNWSIETFTIASIIRSYDITQPIMYTLQDWDKKNVEGSFYEQELQKVSNKLKDVYMVEKVLKKRTRKGVKEIFVKWLGYSDKFNSWIPESNIEHHFNID